jgi:hypothetical protein
VATTAELGRVDPVALYGALKQARPLAYPIWKAGGFKPHLSQAAVLMHSARNKVVSGGRRLGKSEIGAAELDAEVVKTKLIKGWLEETGKRREFWIVGPEYTDSEKEFRKHWDLIKKLGIPMDKPGSYYDAHSGDMQLSLFSGKYLVLGKSAKHPERLVGEGLNGAIMAEAAKMKESVWSKYVRPTLADFNGWSIFASTPEGKNWFYELWQDGQDPFNEEWASWRIPSWMNPYVYPNGATEASIATLRAAMEERPKGFNFQAMVKRLKIDSEIASLVRDLDETTFNQEIGADFSEFVGRVFKDFDEEIHVGDFEYNPDWPLYAAVDYGFTNPFVWLLIQIDPFDNVYVIDEYYETGMTIDDAARDIDRLGFAPSSLLGFYPDPASPEDTLALEKHLKVASFGHTGGELNTRLRYIREGLKVRNKHLAWGDPERKPKLMFNRKCDNCIREFNEYRYPKGEERRDKNNQEAPMKKDDHTPEALGRFYAGYYGQPEAQAGTTRVSKGRFARR